MATNRYSWVYVGITTRDLGSIPAGSPAIRPDGKDSSFALVWDDRVKTWLSIYTDGVEVNDNITIKNVPMRAGK